jgi:hypothetical protein
LGYETPRVRKPCKNASFPKATPEFPEKPKNQLVSDRRERIQVLLKLGAGFYSGPLQSTVPGRERLVPENKGQKTSMVEKECKYFLESMPPPFPPAYTVRRECKYLLNRMRSPIASSLELCSGRKASRFEYEGAIRGGFLKFSHNSQDPVSLFFFHHALAYPVRRRSSLHIQRLIVGLRTRV